MCMDGTPTSEVTPANTPYIHPPNHGHRSHGDGHVLNVNHTEYSQLTGNITIKFWKSPSITGQIYIHIALWKQQNSW